MDLQAPERDVCLELGRNGLEWARTGWNGSEWVGIVRFNLDRWRKWAGGGVRRVESGCCNIIKVE